MSARPNRTSARPHDASNGTENNRMADTTHVLWLTAPPDPALELAAGTRFWKELIREGRWVNAGAGFTLQVDRDRLDAWRDRFDAMRDAGIRVPVPWGHSYDPRDNAGFLEELELRDGALWGLLNLPMPDDADRVGKTVEAVSVSIHPSFVDGTGREWGEVIEHVALTNYPIVTEQADFVRAADHPDPHSAILLEHDAPDPEPDNEPGGDMYRKPDPQKAERDRDLSPDPQPDQPPKAEQEQHRNPHLAPDQPEQLPPAPNSELTNRLYQLELEQAEREVDDALHLGKFTRPAAEALRRLVAAGIENRYSFDRTGVDLAQLARDVIHNTPPGAAVDLTEHTRLHPVPLPGAGMTPARAEQLARENKKLAGV